MFLLRLLIAFAAVLFLLDCRSRTNAAAKEISEAGYTMTSEGCRYVAIPGHKFNSEDGREFILNDVRPSQVVIEETNNGKLRTLRIRGSKG